MKKNYQLDGSTRVLPKFICRIKLLLVILVLFSVQVNASVLFQDSKLTLKFKNEVLSKVLQEIEDNSEFSFFYNSNINYRQKVSIDVKDVEVEEALNNLFNGIDINYELKGRQILLKPAVKKVQEQQKVQIRGMVLDENGEPLPGATVRISGTNVGTVSAADGTYSISVFSSNAILEFSFIGKKKVGIPVKGRTVVDVTMQSDQAEVAEVVVTGIQRMNKDSYTGAAVAIKGEELKAVSNSNLLASISTFDPSFKLQESNEWGSDPNRMPDINIRGVGSLPTILQEEVNNNPNMPTFILDGIEVGVQKIFDLDINRVKSVTILKDASATVIYGSRAANGVLVIETIAPKEGELRVTYTLDAKLAFPDLKDYDLMNAKEKLEAERLAGLFEPRGEFIIEEVIKKEGFYNARLHNVQSGVDTDWISQPLRNGLSQTHSLFLDGGDKKMKYGVSLRYNNTKGVMKGDYRKRYSVDVKLQYRYKNFSFVNRLEVDGVKSQRSPYGDFYDYVRTNPYLRPYDDEGRLVRNLSKDNGLILSDEFQYNPLYEASLKKWDTKESINFADYFKVNWLITKGLRLRTNMSLGMTKREEEFFLSPHSLKYANKKYSEKGEYNMANEKRFFYEARSVLSFFRQIKKHYFDFLVGGSIREEKNNRVSIGTRGFMTDRLEHISYAKQFSVYAPSGFERTSRLAGAFTRSNYTYDMKYLFDFSARLDGSSRFGSKQRSAPFWSVGLGWNVHKESFLKDSFIDELKIKATYGTTGGQRFDPYQAMTKFTYSNTNNYLGYVGAVLKGLGNDDLKWQTSIQKNLGVDIKLFKNRISCSVNAYEKRTKDLLSSFNVAPSVGFSSFKTNVGEVENKGFELSLRAFLIKNKKTRTSLSLFGNVRTNSNKIVRVSEALKAYNEKLVKKLQAEAYDETKTHLSEDANRLESTKPFNQFVEGAPLDGIWVVESFGINPVTGKEIYVRDDGEMTYSWNASDRFLAGKTNPDYEGSFGANFNRKGFSLNLIFNYRYGGQYYNQTLINRVENADLRHNADSRVLYERWTEKGQISFYKKISKDETTRATSRFVQDDNTLNLKSVKVSYEFPKTTTKKLGLSRLKLSAYMKDIFRLSTVEQERGTSYPFERSVAFSITTTF